MEIGLLLANLNDISEKIRRAAELLLSEEASVEWISQRLHFSSPAYFRRVFRKYMGMTPSAYRASGGQRL